MSESNGQVIQKKYTSSSWAHLKAYPIVAETLGFIKGYTLYTYFVNYSKQIYAFVLPYVNALPYLTSALEGIDKFVDDSILTKFDQLFPSITKITYGDLAPSAIYAHVRDRIWTRYTKTTEALIKRVHSVEDRARPTLNPVLAPVNNLLERIIKKIFPESSKDVAGDVVNAAIESVESKDELARFQNLTTTALKKSIPLVSSTRDSVIQLPHEISSHISGVYNEELSSSKNSKEALVKTSRKLSSEALQSLRPIVNPILSSVESFDLKVKVNSGKNYIDGVVEEVRQGVDGGSYNGSSSTGGPAATPIVAASA